MIGGGWVSESTDPEIEEAHKDYVRADYECVNCGFRRNIDGAFRSRERSRCDIDDQIMWFKKR